MNNQLIEQLKNVLPSGMQIPKEIELLYQYIEDNGLYIDNNGFRYGLLYPEDELKASWTENERDGSQSGAEGSECAFWLIDNNELKIVHMGSGSGSILSCVLADNALDFLRLIAIGYDESSEDEFFNWIQKFL